MSLSKIFKTSADIGAEPFVMEELSGLRAGLEEDKEEDIGGALLAREKEAYELGFNAGQRAGFEFGRQKAEVLFSGLTKVIEELANFRESLYKPCEEEMVELALAIAKKVIHREVEVKRDIVLDCVRNALKAVTTGGTVLIKVNLKDLEVLLQNKGELAKYGSGIKGVKIEGDESIAKGGCVIDTNYGEIDSTIASVMAEIEEKLKSAY